MSSKRFHCCATCQHFAIQRTAGTTRYQCARLGYETAPKYQFNCWQPKPHVQKLIEAERNRLQG